MNKIMIARPARPFGQASSPLKNKNIQMKNIVSFKMQLKPGFKEEYKRRHNLIWPELSALLTDAGISNYSIFLDEETNILFAVQTLSGNNSSQDLRKTEIVKKWWAYMADIMDTNEDNSPVSKPLEMMFHMD